MNEQTCNLPEVEQLKTLLKEEKNIVWYMRCPIVEGSPAAKRYLKQQIKKFRSKQKEKYGGL
jgi:hypothetical protein